LAKVAIFFDGKNFYKALTKYNPGLQVDYDKFADWITQQVGGPNAQFAGAYYYTGYEEERTVAGQEFARFLKGLEMLRQARAARQAHCQMQEVWEDLPVQDGEKGRH